MTRKQSLSFADRLTQGAPLAVLLLLSLLILYQLRSVLELIAIAILLSLIFQTLLHQLEKLVKKPWLAVLILSVGILGLTVMFPLVIVPSLLDQMGKLSSQLPQYISNLTSESRNLHEQYQLVLDLSQEISKLNNFIDGVIGSLPQMLAQAFGITIEVFAT
ncbi:AI-2E family transporter [Pleurocapsa sp. FMAR1]|uniref:AI-2E family transporter n=1 Tax=Pleurocapsa sp. FMAR1 TaxID=3040204 RepID=UPI0029C8A95D|nr:AI-2E family transporter [Pleurocapsa sp. FMAR1]